MRETRYNLPCNIAQTLNIIGDRWTLLVLHEILVGTTTFNDLKKELQGISSNILSDRLKHLEQAGLVLSSLYSEHPPRYEYTLTESGKALESVFNAMVLWGGTHLEPCYKKLVHSRCQHEVEIAYYCPHCDENAEEIETVVIKKEVG